MAYTYKYPRPMVTADILLTCREKGTTFILLIRRGKDPFKGMWALPGGYMDWDEPLAQTARRELEEETGIVKKELEPWEIFDRPDRDPRGRTITRVFLGNVAERIPVQGSDDAAEAGWFPAHNLPELAFDHGEVVEKALEENKIP